MIYVQESLAEDEELIHVGKFSILYTFKALLMILWGVAGSLFVIFVASLIYKQMGWFPDNLSYMGAVKNLHPFIRAGSFLFLVFGLYTYAHMMIIRASTEIAVTDRRMIYKRGVVARQVGEMNIDRIEGVNVLQTVMGRIFNYGRLAIRGMGVGQVVLPPIEDPLAFRNAIERAKTLFRSSL